MQMLRLLLVALVALFIAGAVTPVAAQADAIPDPAGSYSCFGEQEGKPYRLELAVEQYGETYRLAWGLSVVALQSSPTVIGLGIRRGDELAVALIHVQAGGVAIATYRISPGQLNGVWSPGDGQVWKEVCSKGRNAA